MLTFLLTLPKNSFLLFFCQCKYLYFMLDTVNYLTDSILYLNLRIHSWEALKCRLGGTPVLVFLWHALKPIFIITIISRLYFMTATRQRRCTLSWGKIHFTGFIPLGCPKTYKQCNFKTPQCKLAMNHGNVIFRYCIFFISNYVRRVLPICPEWEVPNGFNYFQLAQILYRFRIVARPEILSIFSWFCTRFQTGRWRKVW